MVAGIIAAQSTNRLRINSTAPGVKLGAYKVVVNDKGPASPEKIIAAQYQAVDDGCNIIFISDLVNSGNSISDTAIADAAAKLVAAQDIAIVTGSRWCEGPGPLFEATKIQSGDDISSISHIRSNQLPQVIYRAS